MHTITAFIAGIAAAPALAIMLAPRQSPVSTQPVAEALEATSLTLRDARGNAYCRIAHSDDTGAAMTLLDSAGVARVEVALLADQTPRVLLRDKNNTERAKIFLMPDGSPLMYLKDAAGVNRAEFAAMTNGVSGLVVFDDQGRPRQIVGEIPGRPRGMGLLNADGGIALLIGAREDG